MNQKLMVWYPEPPMCWLDGRPTPWSTRVRGEWRHGTPPTLTLAKARCHQIPRGGVVQSGHSPPFSVNKVQTIVFNTLTTPLSKADRVDSVKKRKKKKESWGDMIMICLYSKSQSGKSETDRGTKACMRKCVRKVQSKRESSLLCSSS